LIEAAASQAGRLRIVKPSAIVVETTVRQNVAKKKGVRNEPVVKSTQPLIEPENPDGKRGIIPLLPFVI
jgi:hypothetical protein